MRILLILFIMFGAIHAKQKDFKVDFDAVREVATPLLNESIDFSDTVGPDDYIAFIIESGTGTITLDLTMDVDSDFDLYLYDDADWQVASSASYGNYEEEISEYLDPGEYLIIVDPYNLDLDEDGDGGNIAGDYFLTGNYPSMTPPDLIINSVNISPGDPQYATHTFDATIHVHNTGDIVSDGTYLNVYYGSDQPDGYSYNFSQYFDSIEPGQGSPPIVIQLSWDGESVYGLNEVKFEIEEVGGEQYSNNVWQNNEYIYWLEEPDEYWYDWPATPTTSSHALSSYANEFRDGGYIHQGVDILVAGGQPVLASSSGYISAITPNGSGHGQNITIQFNDLESKCLRYIHTTVQNGYGQGDYVHFAGEQFATIHTYDDSHLHFEDWPDGQNGGFASNPHHPQQSFVSGFDPQWTGDIYAPQIVSGDDYLIVHKNGDIIDVDKDEIDEAVDFIIYARDNLPGRGGLAQIHYRISDLFGWDSGWREKVILDGERIHPNNVRSYLYCSTECGDPDAKEEIDGITYFRYFITNEITQPRTNHIDYRGALDPISDEIPVGEYYLHVKVIDFQGNQAIATWTITITESAEVRRDDRD